MKIFWSWQSDTPKDIGRFFVRDALREAIQALKTDEHVLEPLEREAAAKLERLQFPSTACCLSSASSAGESSLIQHAAERASGAK